MDDDEKDEERQPLNAMVTENLKNVIIRKIYKDVERKAGAGGKGVSPVFRQYLAASGPVIAALSSGMSAGFSAVLLPQLMSEDTEIPITKEEGSWIASMLALPLAIGCIVSGYIMDKLGRKIGQLVSCVPFTVGWIVLAVAPNVPALYIGRFLSGFAVGLMTPMCQVYVAETSEPKHRGILLSGAPLAVAIGILLSHVLGTFLHWRTTAGICGIPPIVCILILIFVFESPIWILGKGNAQGAENAFRWFRGYSEEATNELNSIMNKVTNSNGHAIEEPKITKLQMLCQASFLKPFLVLNFFFFVQQFSGVNAIAFYSVAILKDSVPTVNEYVATIIIDVVRFVVSVIAIILLKKYGRKYLSVVSAIGTACSLFLLAIFLGFFNFKQNEETMIVLNETNQTNNIIETDSPQNYLYILNYLPLVFLIAYISFVSIGLVPIPWVLTGELFSKEMRGIGSGGTSCFGFVCYFLVVKTSPDLFQSLQNYGTFCFFGAICVLGCIILQLFLPETKDKTLTEIEAFYKKKSPLDNPVNGSINAA